MDRAAREVQVKKSLGAVYNDAGELLALVRSAKFAQMFCDQIAPDKMSPPDWMTLLEIMERYVDRIVEDSAIVDAFYNR